ncbi:MAG: hypothetical protein QOD71_1052 [Thermoleophilaceae bacterium]|nr:hypothetical protein [Thermoleophilaceae bacterium]
MEHVVASGYGRGVSLSGVDLMRPRAFVVSPFGHKEIRAAADGEPAVEVDFDELYELLLRPALDQAGIEPFRADQEAGAGDIRTDMFFELVTADVVLADISILNPNVFYELGVRHGIAQRGVFMVHGGWSRRPFDVAPDRTFGYEGALFEPSAAREEQWTARVREEVAQLARRLRDALQVDAQGVGSPVYASLPGLRPADWSGIRTARSRYFMGVLDDWGQRVRIAGRNGNAGDILTLAEDAPTRFHRGRLLFDAARALIDLGRFHAARGVLLDVLALEPDNFQADCQLGLVLNRLGRTDEAEEHMKRLVRGHPGDPEASGMLGRVYKDMWRARWEKVADATERKQAAVQHSGLVSAAADSYNRAYRRHLDYYNGINVVALVRLLEHLRTATGQQPVAPAITDVDDVCVAVRVAAGAALERAADVPDEPDQPDETIWAASTLGELAVVAGDADEARRHYMRAASAPGVTYFQLDSMLSQLRLFELLGFQEQALAAARGVLADALTHQPQPARRFSKVVVASGHMIDAPDRPQPRFPPELEPAVHARMAAQLDDWGIGAGDLAICGGARGADILFAELCLERGADVHLFLALPRAEFLAESVRLPGTDWEDRHIALLARCEEESQPERIGAAPEGMSVFARNNRWMINTARAEADADVDGLAVERLHALLVWDERPTGDGPGGTSDFAAAVESLGGRLAVINPTTVDK